MLLLKMPEFPWEFRHFLHTLSVKTIILWGYRGLFFETTPSLINETFSRR